MYGRSEKDSTYEFSSRIETSFSMSQIMFNISFVRDILNNITKNMNTDFIKFFNVQQIFTNVYVCNSVKVMM